MDLSPSKRVQHTSWRLASVELPRSGSSSRRARARIVPCVRARASRGRAQTVRERKGSGSHNSSSRQQGHHLRRQHRLWPRSSPTATCCQRPTPELVARTRSPLGLARRHVAPYHYYVIDNLVSAARRQGAMSCLSYARPDARPLAGWSAFGLALSRRPPGARTRLLRTSRSREPPPLPHWGAG